MPRMSRCLTIAFVFGCFACRPAGDASTDTAIEENPREEQEVTTAARALADRYMETIQAGNYLGAAAMMHPDALRRFRDLFSALLEMDPKGFAASQLFGRSNIGDLSDAELFASFLNRTLYANPDLQEAVAAAEVEYLGEVGERPDIVHVIYRQKITLAPVALRALNVVSVQPYGSEWRVLLPNEIETMAASLTVAA